MKGYAEGQIEVELNVAPYLIENHLCTLEEVSVQIIQQKYQRTDHIPIEI